MGGQNGIPQSWVLKGHFSCWIHCRKQKEKTIIIMVRLEWWMSLPIQGIYIGSNVWMCPHKQPLDPQNNIAWNMGSCKLGWTTLCYLKRWMGVWGWHMAISPTANTRIEEDKEQVQKWSLKPGDDNNIDVHLLPFLLLTPNRFLIG